MNNHIIKEIDETLASLETAHIEDYDISAYWCQNKLAHLKEMIIAEQRHQEDWKARFMQLRDKHDQIRQIEQERIIQKIVDYRLKLYDEGRIKECNAVAEAINIMKGQPLDEE